MCVADGCAKRDWHKAVRTEAAAIATGIDKIEAFIGSGNPEAQAHNETGLPYLSIYGHGNLQMPVV